MRVIGPPRHASFGALRFAATGYDRRLEQLTAREKRNRSIVKWADGIVATFVAAVLIRFGLK